MKNALSTFRKPESSSRVLRPRRATPRGSEKPGDREHTLLTHEPEATHAYSPSSSAAEAEVAARKPALPAAPPPSRFPGALAAAEGERAAMSVSATAAYLTHQQKVLRLYKRALRHLESWCIHRFGRGGSRARGADPGPPPGWRGGPGGPRISRTSGTEREGVPSPHGSPPGDPGSSPDVAAQGLRGLEELLPWVEPQFPIKDNGLRVQRSLNKWLSSQ